MRKLHLTALAALALVSPLFHAASAAEEAASVEGLTLVVDGTAADGLYALPAGEPTSLVVFAHGLGHNASSWRGHLLEAASHGAAAIAMSYPECFDIDRGAAESVAAAKFLQDTHGADLDTHLLSVSMGSAVAGLALAETPGIFRYWVDVEGVANLFETYAEAKAVGHDSATCIEEDTGGTPATASHEYARRSAALRVAEMRANGVEAAVVVHPVNDGLVPYNQGREMAVALAAESVPTDFYTVLRGTCDDEETTATGYTPVPNALCLAGHGTESSSSQVVIRTGLDALFALMSGERVPDGYTEFVVDRPES